MPTVAFTSDPHFGHSWVSQLRGFGDTVGGVHNHDQTILNNFRKACPGQNDQLWILGDLCMSNPEYSFGLLSELQCELHLILGNHDKAHPMHRDAHRWLKKYYEVFTSVASAASRKISGERVLLSHFPYDGDHTFENRYMQWRLRDEGEILLHGHVHSQAVFNTSNPREIHVGLDAWNLSPVELPIIETLISPLSASGQEG